MMLKIYNSLSRKIEEFKPLNPSKVGMYTCGQTVYDYTHIGHGRKYVDDDILRRTLAYLGFEVLHVQNVTDVGHLVSDQDFGEDKLEKGARKFGKTVWEVAEFFTKHFYESLDKLNILRPNIICKATEHIREQIDLIKQLIDRGFAYETQEAVYFEVEKFKDYALLFGQKLEDKLTGARTEVQKGEHKKGPRDFALWFKRVGRFANHEMFWESPWGKGFPGWHIECSAMSMKYLGGQFDLHTGGEDHLSIHHPNEIAQSEGATGKKPFVKYWVHYAFLKVKGQKMSKSLGNFMRIEEVETKGFDPLALRYFYLTTHYRKPQNFTWEGLQASQTALNKLREMINSRRLKSANPGNKKGVGNRPAKNGIANFSSRFQKAISDDLNMPQALAVVWEMVKSDLSSEEKTKLLLDWDKVLGLDLGNIKNQNVKIKMTMQNLKSEKIKKLIEEREKLRKEKKWQEADKIRRKIEAFGYEIEDTAKETLIKKINKEI